jgi:hypothetical protein
MVLAPQPVALMPYHISKFPRIYDGRGYSGPTCDKAEVPHGKTYPLLREAVKDAKHLKEFNNVGFVVYDVESQEPVFSTEKGVYAIMTNSEWFHSIEGPKRLGRGVGDWFCILGDDDDPAQIEGRGPTDEEAVADARRKYRTRLLES